MAETTHISWADATFNPWIGCTKVSPACANCLADGTRIMMADGSWRKIENVRAGDRLASFSECGTGKVGGNRLLEVGTVEKTWRSRKKTVKIVLESGRSVTCSWDHKFLAFYPRSRRGYWCNAKDLSLESMIYSIGDPDTSSDLTQEYLLGYLAGATAGDGTMRIDGSGRCGTKQSYWRIAVLDDDRAILERIEELFKSCGLDRGIRPFVSTKSKSGKIFRPMVKLEHRSMGAIKTIASMLVEMDSPEWMAGWLGGFFDTDGSVAGSSRGNGITYRWSQKRGRNDYLARASRYLDRLSISHKLEQFEKSKCDTIRLQVDSMNDKVNAVGIIRPALPRKGMGKLYGMRLGLQFDRVIALGLSGEEELNDIQVSTRTFVAEGLCTHNCYAERDFDIRYGRAKWGPNGTRVITANPNWSKPVKWNKSATRRTRVFCASLADVFEDWNGPMLNSKGEETGLHMRDVRVRLFELIDSTPNLDWLLLTKRPENIAKMWVGKYRPNVWLGASCENDDYAQSRLPYLHEAKRLGLVSTTFISAEPLLGDLMLHGTFKVDRENGRAGYRSAHHLGVDGKGIDWVVAGGESGSGARPVKIEWARSLRDQCAEAGIAFHFKQWGEFDADGERVGCSAAGRTLDGIIHDAFPNESKINDIV